MKLEAIKRQGARTDLTSDQVGQKLQNITSREKIAENSPDSSTQIQRYIRLTELDPTLQQMVDDKKIAMTPAVELSYLKPDEQEMLLTAMASEQATPSLPGAAYKKALPRGKLTVTQLNVLAEQKSRSLVGYALRGQATQILSPVLHTTKDGGNHNKAAGCLG